MTNKQKHLNDSGINGKGEKVWTVITEWVSESGREMINCESFDNEKEAKNWMKWS